MLVSTLVRMSGRSWWQCRYQGGKTLSEWDTVTGSTVKALPNSAVWRTSRWEDVPKKGIVGLRLLTPDGRVGELESNNPEGRFVQLKVGGKSFGGGQNGAFTDAHVIGVVDDAGKMMCWAWQREPHAWQPNLANDTVRCYICNLPEEHCTSRDQFAYFTDDVFGMKYRRIGALSLVVQGVKL